MAADRVGPGDPPGLNRRVPGPERRAVHVHPRLCMITRSTRGHDPYILDGASFQHAPRVDFACKALRRDVDCEVAKDDELPTSAQPAVDVRRRRNLWCGLLGRE